MKDLHKYFYSITAACFVALGSGFITATQYALSYEKEGKKIQFQIEEQNKIKIDTKTNCNKLKKNIAKCMYVQHLYASNHAYSSLLKDIANYIFFVLLLSFGVGMGLHYKAIKS